MPDLSRIGEREKLKPKAGDEPHWHRLRQGVYLGYRPSKKTEGGTWFGRFYDADSNRNKRKRLGDYGTLSGHDVFKQAKLDAETWAAMIESGGELAREMVTVKDACEDYLNEKPNSIAEGVFRRHVFDDPIAKVKLDKLRKHHLRNWRARLEKAPAMLSRKAASAYTIRHSVITDLVRARLPILTVAQLAGTSVVMIENHYGHLVRDDAEDALATLAF